MSYVEVVLEQDLIRRAARAGVERQLRNLARGDAHGFNGDGWGVHVEGAAGELAFATAHGLPWIDVADDFSTLPGDVGPFQVRTTARMNGSLIVHERDPDDAPFVLVTGRVPRFVLRGWLYGREAKDSRWWRTDTGRPAYFVPQSALRPIPAKAMEPVCTLAAEIAALNGGTR